MRERRGAGERQARDDREDGRERDRGDEAEERRAGDVLGEQERSRVPALVHRLDRRLPDERHRAEAEHEGQQVEEADEERRPVDRGARSLAVGDGVEAHQDVRQPRRPEHQRQPERERVPVVGNEAPGLEHAGSELLRRVLEEIDRVHPELEQDEEGHHGRAADQQARLDDLHPGGRDHAAEKQEREHHGTDDHDRDGVRQAEDQMDQRPGADHLGDQVEDDDRERAERGRDPYGLLAEPVRDDVREGIAAEVAQRLGDQEEHDRPADQEADRIDQAVEAGQGDEARDAEEARRAHVVAGQREPVLETGDAAAGGVELVGRPRAPRRPPGDPQREQDEEDEEDDGDRVRLARFEGCYDHGDASSSRIAGS